MGILVRSGPLSDPGIQELIAEHFVPVALDVGGVRLKWKFVPESTPNYVPPAYEMEDVSLFAAIERQDPLSQGVWLTTPEGKVLRSSYQVYAEPMLDVMRLALEDWRKQGAPNPSPLPVRRRRADLKSELVEGGVRLRIYGRLLDGGNLPPFRDSLDLSPQELERLLPTKVEPGVSVKVPDELLVEIATRLYPGEMRVAVRPEEVRQVGATITINAVEDGIARAKLEGYVELEGEFPFSSRRRLLQSNLIGEMEWRVEPRQLASLQIVSDGIWQAEYPEGVSPTKLDVYPVAIPSARMVMSPPIRMMFLIELARAEADRPPPTITHFLAPTAAR